MMMTMMSCLIFDGKSVAKVILRETKSQVKVQLTIHSIHYRRKMKANEA